MTLRSHPALTFILSILLVLLLLVPVGCKRKMRKPDAKTFSEDGGMATFLSVADPRSEHQLISGFYCIEADSWRWTAKAFSLTLRTPRNPQQGTALVLNFAIPDTVLNRLKSISLSAAVNGTALPGQQYTSAGDQTYRREVPASVFHGESIRVDFMLDKALMGDSADSRELGVVAKSVGLEAR